jgi:hypothetical protein
VEAELAIHEVGQLKCAESTRIEPDGRSQPVADAREMPAEPEKSTAIPHLEGKGEESFLEESRGNRVYTRRRVLEAFSLLLYVAKFRAE